MTHFPETDDVTGNANEVSKMELNRARDVIIASDDQDSPYTYSKTDESSPRLLFDDCEDLFPSLTLTPTRSSNEHMPPKRLLIPLSLSIDGEDDDDEGVIEVWTNEASKSLGMNAHHQLEIQSDKSCYQGSNEIHIRNQENVESNTIDEFDLKPALVSQETKNSAVEDSPNHPSLRNEISVGDDSKLDQKVAAEDECALLESPILPTKNSEEFIAQVSHLFEAEKDLHMERDNQIMAIQALEDRYQGSHDYHFRNQENNESNTIDEFHLKSDLVSQESKTSGVEDSPSHPSLRNEITVGDPNLDQKVAAEDECTLLESPILPAENSEELIDEASQLYDEEKDSRVGCDSKIMTIQALEDRYQGSHDYHFRNQENVESNTIDEFRLKSDLVSQETKNSGVEDSTSHPSLRNEITVGDDSKLDQKVAAKDEYTLLESPILPTENSEELIDEASHLFEAEKDLHIESDNEIMNFGLTDIEPISGMRIDFRDKEYIWSSARIINVRRAGDPDNKFVDSVIVRYTGWDSKWDETVRWPNVRIAKVHTYSRVAKCLARLMYKNERLGSNPTKNANNTDLWPCKVYLRMPHPGDSESSITARDHLRLENKVFVQPYGWNESFLPKSIVSYCKGGVESGRWINTCLIRPWEKDLSRLGALHETFDHAFHLAFIDSSASENLPRAVFEKGSLLKAAYRVATVGNAKRPMFKDESNLSQSLSYVTNVSDALAVDDWGVEFFNDTENETSKRRERRRSDQKCNKSHIAKYENVSDDVHNCSGETTSWRKERNGRNRRRSEPPIIKREQSDDDDFSDVSCDVELQRRHRYGKPALHQGKRKGSNQKRTESSVATCAQTACDLFDISGSTASRRRKRLETDIKRTDSSDNGLLEIKGNMPSQLNVRNRRDKMHMASSSIKADQNDDVWFNKIVASQRRGQNRKDKRHTESPIAKRKRIDDDFIHSAWSVSSQGLERETPLAKRGQSDRINPKVSAIDSLKGESTMNKVVSNDRPVCKRTLPAFGLIVIDSDENSLNDDTLHRKMPISSNQESTSASRRYTIKAAVTPINNFIEIDSEESASVARISGYTFDALGKHTDKGVARSDEHNILRSKRFPTKLGNDASGTVDSPEGDQTRGNLIRKQDGHVDKNKAIGVGSLDAVPFIGMRVDFQDKEYIWSPARIICVHYASSSPKFSKFIDSVTIRYLGWGPEWDESVEWPNARIAQIHTYSKVAKCFARLMPRARDKFCNGPDDTDLWPYKVFLRMPQPGNSRHSKNSMEQLSLENKVLLQPYGWNEGLIPDSLLALFGSDFDSGRWSSAKFLRSWENDVSQFGMLRESFHGAFRLALADSNTPGLPPAAFEKGSLLKAIHLIQFAAHVCPDSFRKNNKPLPPAFDVKCNINTHDVLDDSGHTNYTSRPEKIMTLQHRSRHSEPLTASNTRSSRVDIFKRNGDDFDLRHDKRSKSKCYKLTQTESRDHNITKNLRSVKRDKVSDIVRASYTSDECSGTSVTKVQRHASNKKERTISDLNKRIRESKVRPSVVSDKTQTTQNDSRFRSEPSSRFASHKNGTTIHVDVNKPTSILIGDNSESDGSFEYDGAGKSLAKARNTFQKLVDGKAQRSIKANDFTVREKKSKRSLVNDAWLDGDTISCNKMDTFLSNGPLESGKSTKVMKGQSVASVCDFTPSRSHALGTNRQEKDNKAQSQQHFGRSKKSELPFSAEENLKGPPNVGISENEPEVGMGIDFRDSEYIWSSARIVSVHYAQSSSTKKRKRSIESVTVRYTGWGPEWDETVDWPNVRIANLHTYSKVVKCFARLMPKTESSGIDSRTHVVNTDIWPCKLFLRMPHPGNSHDCTNAKEQLSLENRVFVQPYGWDLMPDSLIEFFRDNFDNGRWISTSRMRPWKDDMSQLGLLHESFHRAFRLAETDPDVGGSLPYSAFEKGSLLKFAYRVQIVGEGQSTAFQDGRHVASASSRAKLEYNNDHEVHHNTAKQRDRQTKTGKLLPSRYSQSSNFMIHDSEKNPMMFGNCYMVRVETTAIKPDANCFLSYQWGSRLFIQDVILKENVSIDSTIEQFGFTMSLISCKVNDSEKGGRVFMQCCNESIRVAYAIVAGPNLETRSIKEELEKIADFSTLTTRKVVARLELLQSTCHKFNGKSAIRILNSSDFCSIEESGHVGCGFISEEMLYEMCGGTPSARKVICIQVRLIIPSMGIFKGMLMKKNITHGPPIQLPSSMCKVGPSKDPTHKDIAFMLINQAGVDPSDSNKNVARMPSINPSSENPPRSFEPKPLSDMIRRLLKGLLVPHVIVNNYARQSRQVSGLNHAFVRGVADPTGKLPPGSVYLTGCVNKSILGESLFVTRSPCIKCSDACMVPVIRQCPKGMEESEWEWLESLPFGALVFAFPRSGCKPLPEMIANGDLDGDRYFVCWNKLILEHIVTDPINNKKPADESEEKPRASNKNWFEDAQLMMADAAKSAHASSQLIGKLYSLSLQCADESELFMRDPKAEAFADAYYTMLDNAKHGYKVKLKRELYEMIPPNMRNAVELIR